MRYINLIRNLSNWELYLAVKAGLTQTDPLRFVTRSHVKVEVPRRLVQTFKEIFMDECYMQGLGRPVTENASIIDIGANAGYFSLFALARFPGVRVVAFEPLPANFCLLERQKANNGSLPMACVNKAVAGSPGYLELAYDATDSFSTSATLFKGASGQLDAIRVEATTLHDILAEFKIVRCDLLKMDCEGAEYEILYRLPPEDLQRISQIAMEVHNGSGEGENIDALETFLKTSGFKTRRRPVGMLWAWRE